MTISNLASSSWIGRSPDFVPEFWPPEFDDRPNITRDMEPVRLLRTGFHVAGDLARATLAITARGIYSTYLDGIRVGDEELSPGWTDYFHRLAVQEVDVTSLLSEGDHAWGIELADGWYAGYLGMDRRHQAGLYGSSTSARAALTLEYADGSTSVIRTGPDWTMGTGAIQYADLLMGQFTDFSADRPGWAAPGFDGAGFEPVWSDDSLDVALVPQSGPPVRVTEVRPAVSVTPLDTTRVIVDFGQNIVGRVRLRLPGGVGHRVHVRHGEALEPDGELYTANLRTARAHDIVVTGAAETVFEPRYTFHGFRYVEVRDYPGELRPEHIDAVVIGTDVPTIGHFETSDARLGQLVSNISWTIRGNLVSVPTDCPQRDERLGWMGDAGIIMASANYEFDLAGFIGKWLVDIRDGQAESGAYPDVAPKIVVPVDGSPGWGDAGVLVPWTTYLFTGDLSLLAGHYDSMVRFLEHVERNNPSGIREHAVSRNYGDWLSLDADTPKALVATAYWKRSTDALAGSARALGLDDARWVALSARIAEAFAARFIAAGGRIGTGTQSGYALAFDAQLVPEHLRAAAAAHLRDDIASRGGALSTGIHGLRALMPALADNGLLDVAHQLLARDEYPSWLYPVTRGATTVWERWDGYTDERGFQTPAMNSLNHYALGSVGEWLYGYLGGIRPAAPGFTQAIVRPHPGGSLTSCSVSRAGLTAAWTRTDDRFTLDVSVPPGCTATVFVPSGATEWERYPVRPGTHHFESDLSPNWNPAPAP